MLSQQQNNMHLPEEETPPPLDQKHTATSASSWRGWSLWLRVLGVIVALVAPFALAFDLAILLLVLLGALSAGLLRSWWAMLIIPVAFSVGFFLSNIFEMVGGIDLPWVFPNFEGLDIFWVFIVPLAIGAAIGILIGKAKVLSTLPEPR
jgi:hypothetical protein